jgi:ornithine cyclodeaminase/alanine dehydrogenase-like protein (mu-crystallin family)
MVLYIRDAECRELIDAGECIRLIEDLFRQEADGKVENHPTTELNLPKGILRLKAGGTYGLNTFGFKAYPAGGRYLVFVYDLDTGLDGIVEARGLTEARTGAVSAVGTKYLANAGASTLAIIGTGREARAQLAYIASVAPLHSVRAYSRSAENREAFAREMSARLGIEVRAAASGEECVRGAEIVTTITSANAPVLEGAWLSPGAHINAVGATTPNRRELDDEAVARAHAVIVEHLPQARAECGELLHAAQSGRFSWDRVIELKDVIAGGARPRQNRDDITLFDTIGVGAEDVAVATYVLQKARKLGAGTELPFEPPYNPSSR